MVVVAEWTLLNYLMISMLLSVGSSFDLEKLKLMLSSSPINTPVVLSKNFGQRGRTEGDAHTITISVSSGERLFAVFGHSDDRVKQLGFVTNWGRVYGPYGENGGEPFTVNSCVVKGIFG